MLVVVLICIYVFLLIELKLKLVSCGSYAPNEVRFSCVYLVHKFSRQFARQVF